MGGSVVVVGGCVVVVGGSVVVVGGCVVVVGGGVVVVGGGVVVVGGFVVGGCFVVIGALVVAGIGGILILIGGNLILTRLLDQASPGEIKYASSAIASNEKIIFAIVSLKEMRKKQSPIKHYRLRALKPLCLLYKTRNHEVNNPNISIEVRVSQSLAKLGGKGP